MKKIFTVILYTAVALAVAGCAKADQPGPNDANKRFFDAWIKVHHPDVKPTGLGIYVIEETEGSGAVVGKDGFAIVDYTITDLEGNITSFTDKMTAKQLGKYDTAYYYGSKVWTTAEGTIQAGVAEALLGMKAGGSKKVIIPSWLMTYKTYDTAEDYINPPKKKNETTSVSYDNAIYNFTVRDFATDINEWEIGEIGDYFMANPSMNLTAADSLQYGFYYKQLTAPTDTTSFPKDTTIYINYTGRLLNGLVFDTTDERTAKFNGIYSSSRDYKPVSVKWNEKYSDITLGGSTIIGGFGLTLWQMRAFEKGVGIFYSPLGYSYSGKGSSIPGYAPLIFEIEIVEKPKN
jgi:FKBP-type peptidyl-prolyl cis-trans isomerase